MRIRCSTNPIALSGIALIVMLAGCRGDPANPPGALTKAEALILLRGIAQFPLSWSSVASVDTAIACPLGGEAKLVGTSSGTTVGDTVRRASDHVVTPSGCKLDDGIAFTVDGDPSFRQETNTDYIYTEGNSLMRVVRSGGMEGLVKWQVEDRNGDCAINLPLNATWDRSDPDNPRWTGGYKGKMCGHDIDLGLIL